LWEVTCNSCFTVSTLKRGERERKSPKILEPPRNK
jgi:hypothetical protein